MPLFALKRSSSSFETSSFLKLVLIGLIILSHLSALIETEKEINGKGLENIFNVHENGLKYPEKLNQCDSYKIFSQLYYRNWSPAKVKCPQIWASSYNQETEISDSHIATRTETKILKVILIPGALLFIFIVISYGLMHLTRVAKLVNKFPGPSTFPIVGSVYILAVPPESLVTALGKYVEKFGRCFQFWVFHTPYIVITEAAVAEKVLSSSVHIDKGQLYSSKLKWFLGNGLVTSDVKTWKEDRKLLNPTFKYQRFDGFLASFNKHGKILTEILENKFSASNMVKELDLHPTFCMCTMDSISEAALGQKSSFQNDPNLRFVEELHFALKSIRVRALKPWLSFPIVWDIFGFGRKERECIKYFMDTLSRIIKHRKMVKLTEDEGTTATKPFIDTMLDCRTDEHIVFHVITTFAAGFETTASALNYTLYLLAINPDIQAQVHQELDRVFYDDMHRDVTFGDLAEMKYLEMCIKESLRLFPPVPNFIRSIKSDIPLDNGLVIPRGAEALFILNELHRDPRVFSNPEKFEPNRFLPAACAARSAYSYFPFSIGSRSCIGQKYALMQMKVVLSNILRRFSVSSSKLRENLLLFNGIVLEPQGGIPLNLKKRM